MASCQCLVGVVMHRSWTAPDVAGAAGIAGVIIPAAGLAISPIWDFPGTGVSAPALTAFVLDHRPQLQVTTLLYAVGVTLWLVFGVATAAHLYAVVAPRSPRTAVLAMCLAAGAVGFVTLLLAGFTCFDVLIYRAPHVADPRPLYDLTFGLLAMSGLPTAAALGAYALLAHGRRVVPLWSIQLAVVTAVAHLALPVSFILTRGFASLEGQIITVVPALLWAWILGTGCALTRRTKTCVRA